MLSSFDAVKHRDFSPCLCNGNVQWDEDALLLYLSCIALWSAANPVTTKKKYSGMEHKGLLAKLAGSKCHKAQFKLAHTVHPKPTLSFSKHLQAVTAPQQQFIL